MSEATDRTAINDVLVRYVWALDTKDWDALDDVFVPGAHVDYSESGGIEGTVEEFKPWVAKMLSAFPMTQHLLMNVEISVDGDAATARSACYNPMGAAKRDGGTHLFFIGIEYHDRLERRPEGWRITDRYEKQRWFDGTLPDELVFPERA
jgi:hypothetical protein